MRLDRLRNGGLARTREHLAEVARQSGLAAPTSMSAWGEQLDMLQGIRKALDVFKPMVFERPPDQLVAATASAEWRAANGVEMGRVERNRFRKQAKDMVRPGVVVPDLHEALLHLQTQREIWIKHSPAVAWPKLPEAMAAIDGDYRVIREDIDALSLALRHKAGAKPLVDESFEDLAGLIEHLHATRAHLAYLPTVAALRQRLEGQGLGALVDDLRSRRVGLQPPKLPDDAGPGYPLPALSADDQQAAQMVGFELDLAWWSSVLGFILAADPLLASHSGESLNALFDSYKELDSQHIATKPAPIQAAALAWRDEAAQNFPGQAAALAGGVYGSNLRGLLVDCAEMALRARPAWLAGPMLVPQALPLAEAAKPVVDLVILDAAGDLTVAQAVPSLARGTQVVVLGDSARVTSAPGESALAGLAEFLPRLTLQAPASSRDPRLAAFLTANGYGSLAAPLPLPTREDLISLTTVDGVGQVVDGAANVESVEAEVLAVLRAVVSHVRLRGWESLAVITVSQAHAERISYALTATAETVPELAAALDAKRLEPLEVLDVTRAHAVQRDAILFSPGFAKTPHGHVLHDFGSVGQPGGVAWLLDTLLACRHRLSVVSCLKASDLTQERLRDPGSQLFANILQFAENPGQPAEPHGQQAGALFADLAERLAARGMKVRARYGLQGAPKIAMTVSHPCVPQRELVAILTDDADFVAEPSVRSRVRQRAADLERLGWRTIQVWSPAVFMDPEGQARAIAAVAGAELDKLRPGFDMSA
jgi:hypothetical protein